MRASRRTFLLASITASARAADPTERVRFLDPGTEFEVYRLTDPAHSAILPPTANRAAARRGNLLLYSSDRSGSLQAWSMDLKSWRSTQLTTAEKLDPASLTLTPDERAFCYLDGNDLMLGNPRAARARKVTTLDTGATPGSGLVVTPDGPAALVVDGGTRLVAVLLSSGVKRTLCEDAEGLRAATVRPRRASVLVRSGNRLLLVNLDGQRTVALKTPAEGTVGTAQWAADGKTVLYLHYPESSVSPAHLREMDPDTGEDRKVLATSQFADLAANADSSVLIGASSSKAGPYVILIVRSVRRELTLCEHKASDPSAVNALFSADSQRIFFQSDRHGKPAIYSMTVEKLVERTENEDEKTP